MKTNSSNKKIFQPDTLCKYILETFPRIEGISMTNFINEAVKDYYRPVSWRLCNIYEMICDGFCVIDGTYTIRVETMKRAIADIVNESAHYEPMFEEFMRELFYSYIKSSNDYAVHNELSTDEEEFLSKYKLFLKSVDGDFNYGSDCYSDILESIFGNWDRVKYISETYRVLEVIAMKGLRWHWVDEEDIFRLFHWLKEVDLFVMANTTRYSKSKYDFDLSKFYLLPEDYSNVLAAEIETYYLEDKYKKKFLGFDPPKELVSLWQAYNEFLSSSPNRDEEYMEKLKTYKNMFRKEFASENLRWELEYTF